MFWWLETLSSMKFDEANSGGAPRRILIAEPIPLCRQAISGLIQQQADLSLVGAYTSAEEILRVLEFTPVDLVTLELSDKDGAGLDRIRDLRLRYPQVRVLILSAHSEDIFAERALQVGANGFVSKLGELEIIVGAIRKVAAGETYFSEQLSSRLALKYLGVGASAGASPLDGLSNRELQVFRLIGSGQPTRAIAEALGISIKTVETYVDHLKRKLGVRSGVALTHRAVQWMERGILQ